MSELDRKLVRGSAWLALSYGGSQVISLVVTAILARLVTPSVFGLIALASIAIVALTTLQESGLGVALIHRRSDIEAAAGTALVFTSIAAVAIYGISYVTAPLVARIFSEPDLSTVLRVLALTVIVRGVGVVPGALIERELAFASRAKGELGGTIVQALTSIPLAALGYGVWSLVAGQLAGQVVQTLVFWMVAPHRPSPRAFSWPILRELGRYGRHVTAGNLVAFVDQNVDTGTVGRLLGTADVGFYNLAWRLSNLPATGVGYVVGRVMLPAYATLQNDKPAFRAAFLTNVRRVALVSLPVGVGILVAAHPIVVGIFGARWEPAVGPLQILAAFGLIRSFSSTTGPVFQAAGRPQLIFYLNLWHLAVLLAGLFALAPFFGLRGVASAVTIAAFASFIPALWLALKILDLPTSELLRNLARPARCSVPLVAALLGLELSIHDLRTGVQLVLLIACGLLVYSVTAFALARSDLKAITAAFRSS